MPKNKNGQDEHLRGASDKEQRMFEHIVDEAKKDGRGGDCAEEVAARTVMKHLGEEDINKHDEDP